MFCFVCYVGRGIGISGHSIAISPLNPHPHSTSGLLWRSTTYVVHVNASKVAPNIVPHLR